MLCRKVSVYRPTEKCETVTGGRTLGQQTDSSISFQDPAATLTS